MKCKTHGELKLEEFTFSKHKDYKRKICLYCRREYDKKRWHSSEERRKSQLLINQTLEAKEKRKIYSIKNKEKLNERAKQYRIKRKNDPKYRNMVTRLSMKAYYKSKEQISDSYVKRLLGFKHIQVNPVIIEIKRAILKLKILIKNKEMMNV